VRALRLYLAPLLALAALLALPAVAGCMQGTRTDPRSSAPGKHAVRVNATAAAPATKGTSFHLVATEPKNESTLLYAETARLVRNALNTRGLYEAPSASRAGIIVEIEYGMAAPRATGPANRDPAATAAAATTPATPPLSGANTRPLIVEDPTQFRTAQRGPLEKTLVLKAREVKPGTDGPPRTMWTVELSVTDISNDLRKYLPVLATAAIDQIGVDSDGEKTVTIDETDKSVGLVKKR
jgi:hypothetical protein